ncbi:MAG: hypothetical protein RLZZ142_68, partial [Verrucomicrobiota bacterium]
GHQVGQEVNFRAFVFPHSGVDVVWALGRGLGIWGGNAGRLAGGWGEGKAGGRRAEGGG